MATLYEAQVRLVNILAFSPEAREKKSYDVIRGSRASGLCERFISGKVKKGQSQPAGQA